MGYRHIVPGNVLNNKWYFKQITQTVTLRFIFKQKTILFFVVMVD